MKTVQVSSKTAEELEKAATPYGRPGATPIVKVGRFYHQSGRKWDLWLWLAQRGDWSLGGMAQDCKLSVRQLQRCFNRDVGPGPREWIHDQRLLLSRRLLLEKASIKEVSLMLHYRDQSEFTHAFKRLFKVTPSEYIRRFWDSWLNHRSKPEEGEDAARP